jgi:hypothetical protein
MYPLESGLTSLAVMQIIIIIIIILTIMSKMIMAVIRIGQFIFFSGVLDEPFACGLSNLSLSLASQTRINST